MNDTMTIDERASLRVMQARAELITARRFYGTLIANVEPVCSRQFPTMATNAKQHFFNPDFVMGLKKNHRGQEVHPAKLMLGVQAHESEHDARHHGTRRGERDPKRWNQACDFAINGDLIAEGFELPEGALIDARFAGMSAEDIFRTLQLDEQRNQPPQQPEVDEDETGDEGQNGPESPQEGPGEAGEDEGEDDSQGDQDATQGQQDGPGEASAQGEGDEESESDDSDSTGNGALHGAERQGTSRLDKLWSGAAWQAEGDGESEQSGSPDPASDPGCCGEVLDSAADAGDISEQDARWERIVRQAVSVARAAGQVPGHVTRDIAKANDPGQDWREVLRAWFDHGSLQIETWNRPNRRFVGTGLYLPGKARDGINRVAFLIDTSGSMDAVALKLIRNETQTALDDGVIDEVVCVYGDTQVNRVDTWRTGDEMDFDPCGGGGTVLQPLFDHVAEVLDDVSLIVCFTDGFIDITSQSPQPDCPVLWAFTGYPTNVRDHIANAPWGAPAIDVGEH